MTRKFENRCFSFGFYIKPQLYVLILPRVHGCFSFGFYIKPQHWRGSHGRCVVVSHSDSTSNHNARTGAWRTLRLFLIRILHQTTTVTPNTFAQPSCFSFGFYIKPQRHSELAILRICCFSFGFYIKPQHYQNQITKKLGCFSFGFYIKPQLANDTTATIRSCFSFGFYIKPQRRPMPVYATPVVSHSDSTSNHNY